jgi:hypothetical protein
MTPEPDKTGDLKRVWAVPDDDDGDSSPAKTDDDDSESED